jgi:hypothetical protein
MRSAATTPEELEALLEDAFVIRDYGALAELFDESAVMAAGKAAIEARGRREISRCAAALWERDCIYVAAPQRILQAHDTGLVVSEGSVNVMRRAPDRSWRFAISLLQFNQAPTKGTSR